jgi:hypothetical protein
MRHQLPRQSPLYLKDSRGVVASTMNPVVGRSVMAWSVELSHVADTTFLTHLTPIRYDNFYEEMAKQLTKVVPCIPNVFSHECGVELAK